jgi:hypothetical protein
MNNSIHSHTIEDKIRAVLSTPEPSPEFLDRLEAQLRQHQIQIISFKQKPHFFNSNNRSYFMQTMRARPILALLIVILALLAMTGIVYALGLLTGFLPGFGFTSETGSVSVLAEPVEATVGGATLHVNQAVNDGERFWVELTATGLAEQEESSKVFVLLPGGEQIQFQTGGVSQSPEGKTRLSYLFPPIAGQPQELTLLVEGLGGKDFSLSLKLRPVKASEIVPVPPQENMRLQSETYNGVRLVLDHIAVDSSKTVFQVSLKYDQPNTWLAGPWNVTLSDAAGALYPLTNITPDTMTRGDTRIYQTVPFTGAEKVLLKLVTFPLPDTLPMFVDLSGDSPSFTFDPGSNPTIGQRWELNQAFSAGGFTLKVVSATLTDESSLIFEVEPGASVTGVMFYSPDPATGSKGGVPASNGNVTSAISFSKIPQHPFEVQLRQIYYQAKGLWTIQWQPPAAPTPDPKSPTSTATPTQSALPTPTLANSDPIIREVQQLAQKFDAPFQQGPGWVHVDKETISSPRAGQVFPLPYLKSEDWYEVDANGYVLSNVHLDYDKTGQIIQQVATVDNYSVNFTTGDSGFNNSMRYRFSLDVLTESLSRVSQDKNSRFTRKETTCDNGRPCLLITSLEPFSSPMQNRGEAQTYSGSGRRTWIDMQTGQQVKEQSFGLVEDGSEQITSTYTYTLVEKVSTPPQAILDILARVVVP